MKVPEERIERIAAQCSEQFFSNLYFDGVALYAANGFIARGIDVEWTDGDISGLIPYWLFSVCRSISGHMHLLENEIVIEDFNNAHVVTFARPDGKERWAEAIAQIQKWIEEPPIHTIKIDQSLLRQVLHFEKTSDPVVLKVLLRENTKTIELQGDEISGTTVIMPLRIRAED